MITTIFAVAVRSKASGEWVIEQWKKEAHDRTSLFHSSSKKVKPCAKEDEKANHSCFVKDGTGSFKMTDGEFGNELCEVEPMKYEDQWWVLMYSGCPFDRSLRWQVRVKDHWQSFKDHVQAALVGSSDNISMEDLMYRLKIQ
jgi:hypothetical protein